MNRIVNNNNNNNNSNNSNNNNNFIYPFDWQNIKKYKDKYKKYQKVRFPKIAIKLKNLEAKMILN